MTNKQSEQSNTPENVEDANRETSSQILVNEAVKGTPFRVVGNNTQGYALTLGKYRLTEPKPTKEEVIENTIYVDWNLIANMIVTVIKTYDEMEEGEIKSLDNI